MKTKLPDSINSPKEAEAFMKALHENHEMYHPDDDAHDIIWVEEAGDITEEDMDKLNELMEQACDTHPDIYAYQCELIGEPY